MITTKRNLKTFEVNIINKYYKLITSKNNNYKFKICHCFKEDTKISSIFGVIHDGIFYYLIPLVLKVIIINIHQGDFILLI